MHLIQLKQLLTMKRLLFFLMLLPSLVSGQTPSELIARWGVSFNWSTFTYNPAITYPNNPGSLTAGNVYGNGINMSMGLEGYTGSNWPTSSTTPNYARYFQFTVAPVQGKNLQPKFFRLQQQGSCRKFQVRYSTDPSFPGNGTLLLNNTNAANVQNQFINVPFPANLNVVSGQTLYIRVYGYHKNSGTTWTINHNGALSEQAPEFYGTTTNSITANPDAATTLQGQSVNINVTANDVTSLTTISSVTIQSQSPNGNAVVQPNKTITFIPNPGYSGTTTFQYKIIAANGASSTADVTVTVTPIIPFVADNDSVTLIKNTSVTINVLSNDVMGSGSVSSIVVLAQPLQGIATVVNNAISYIPNSGYVGSDSFTYQVTDSYNNISAASVSVTVNDPVLPPPGSNAGVYCPSSTTWNGLQWSNGVPNATKDAIFTANYTHIAGNLRACSMHVTGNAEVRFILGTNAIVTHSVNVAGTASLTFDSSANLLQVENTPNTGNVTVKRYSSRLKRLDYTFWSSPVTGSQTLKEFSPATISNRFYVYHTSINSYLSVPSATTTFLAGKGYLIRMPDVITGAMAGAYASGNYRFCFEGIFNGVPNNGTVTIPIEYADQEHSFNSVGNPYPSPISITDFILANINNIEGTLWFWRKTNNPNETSYCTATTFGYIANNAPGGGGGGGNDGNDLIADPWGIDPEGVLNTGQAFIVKAKSNQNVVFTNSMRKTNNFANFFRNGNDDAEEYVNEDNSIVADRIWLNVSNNEETKFAQALLGYTASATMGYDDGLDGKSLFAGSINLYTIAGENKLGIQARPDFNDSDVVLLGFMTYEAGEFTITLDHVDGLFEVEQAIYIKDSETGITHNLKDSSYTFSSDAGTFENRFEIVYAAESLKTPGLIASNTIISSYNKQVKITSGNDIRSIIVYDVLGRILYVERDINQCDFLTPQILGTSQVIIVHAEISGQATKKTKIILK